jgi:hypothetical protein
MFLHKWFHQMEVVLHPKQGIEKVTMYYILGFLSGKQIWNLDCNAFNAKAVPKAFTWPCKT